MSIPENSHSWWIETVSRGLGYVYRLLYHRFSSSYDLIANIVSGGKWVEWASAVIPYVPAGNCLELGHGPGHLLAALNARGHKMVGLDLSLEMSRLASGRSKPLPAPFSVVNGAAEQLPFPDSHFSVAIATFPAPAIYSQASLSEIHRVLKPDGIFISLPMGLTRPSNLLDLPGHIMFRFIGVSTGFLASAAERLVELHRQAGFTCQVIPHQHQNAELLLLRAKKALMVE